MPVSSRSPFNGRRPAPGAPAVVFQPAVGEGLSRGMGLLADALRPTLGPSGRAVAVDPPAFRGAPEILDDASTIARRINALGGRSADVGAMLLRQMLWKMHEEVGDGGATAAVLTQSLLEQGMRVVVAGAVNAMALRRALESEANLVSAALAAAAQPLEGQAAIARVAYGMCRDRPLADLLGEIFDIVGGQGVVQIESSDGRDLEREYVEGAYWPGGWFTSLMQTDPGRHEAVLTDAAVLITDRELQDPEQLLPILDEVVRAGSGAVFIIARHVSERVLGLLLRNRDRQTIRVLAVHVPMTGTIDHGALEDIAVITGGRVVCEASGESLERLKLTDLGRARRVWATPDRFGIVGGKGDPRLLRRHIADLRGALARADGAEREKLRFRCGQLMGGVAVLRVGGVTNTERDARKALAEQAARAVRSALLGGTVAGGGAGLLASRSALEREPAGCEAAAAARGILARGLEEPLRAIAANAGYVPDTVVEMVRAAPAGYGFDASTGRIVDMVATGIVDGALTLDRAVRLAVGCASLALSTDVIVHRRRPPECIEP